MSTRSVGLGALAGLAGGVVFGVLMQSMDMLGMVARLAGGDDVALGWGVHLVNSAIIGAIFGALLGTRLGTWLNAAVAGLLYGAAWWVVGALLIMPLWLGMPPFQVGGPQLWSLVGHLLYGLVTGIVLRALSPADARRHGMDDGAATATGEGRSAPRGRRAGVGGPVDGT